MTGDGRECQVNLALRGRAGRAAGRAAAPAGTRHQPPGIWPGPAGFTELAARLLRVAAEAAGETGDPRGSADVVGLAGAGPARCRSAEQPQGTEKISTRAKAKPELDRTLTLARELRSSGLAVTIVIHEHKRLGRGIERAQLA